MIAHFPILQSWCKRERCNSVVPEDAREGFGRFAKKLESNVYNSLKGRIRLVQLQNDFEDFCPPFSLGGMHVLDIGGGGGDFSKICLERKHSVVLCDSSLEMLRKAEENLKSVASGDQLRLVHCDFLKQNPIFDVQYDLVIMHGSAEWMESPEKAVRKSCNLVKNDGFYSLLMFNKEKYDLKRGINGHLFNPPLVKKKKLIPPGAMSVKDTEQLLLSENAEIAVQSGVRIFYNFFRQFTACNITDDDWLMQETEYSRMPPFSLLGEHSHFLCTFTRRETRL